MEEKVTILMAVYNGEKYLREQLDSILSQTHENWQLVIRDDRSTDKSLAILTEYLQRDPRIMLLSHGSDHGSACINFSQLAAWAASTDAAYVMFADQDDRWKPEKVSVSLAAIFKMEQELGTDHPCMCYSTFQLMDEKGEDLPQRMPLPNHLPLMLMLSENYAWGCTMIINSAALKKITPIPYQAANHDYWIALVISALGNNQLIDRDLLFYRQHTQNVSGNVDKMSFTQRFKRYVVNIHSMLKPLTENLITVQLFFNRYQQELKKEDSRQVAAFIGAYQQGVLPLLTTLMKYRIFKLGLGKNVVYFYSLIRLRKQVIAQTKIQKKI